MVTFLFFFLYSHLIIYIFQIQCQVSWEILLQFYLELCWIKGINQFGENWILYNIDSNYPRLAVSIVFNAFSGISIILSIKKFIGFVVAYHLRICVVGFLIVGPSLDKKDFLVLLVHWWFRS